MRSIHNHRSCLSESRVLNSHLINQTKADAHIPPFITESDSLHFARWLSEACSPVTISSCDRRPSDIRNEYGDRSLASCWRLAPLRSPSSMSFWPSRLKDDVVGSGIVVNLSESDNLFLWQLLEAVGNDP